LFVVVIYLEEVSLPIDAFPVLVIVEELIVEIFPVIELTVGAVIVERKDTVPFWNAVIASFGVPIVLVVI